MNVQQAIEILRTQPYKRVGGVTHDGNGCFCALGILILGAGWDPVPNRPNAWVKDDWELHAVVPSQVPVEIDLPFDFLGDVMVLSDTYELDGPDIARKLDGWTESRII